MKFPLISELFRAPHWAILLVFSGCAAVPRDAQNTPSSRSPGSVRPPAERFALEPSSLLRNPKLLWKRKLPGFLTDLDVAEVDGSLLAAVIPDPDSPNPGENQVIRLSADGDTLWRKSFQTRAKSISLANDGSLSIVQTYLEEVVAFDRAGRKRWSVEASCRPVAVARSHRVLCYHDDDAAPGTAFDVYSWQGRKLEARKSPTDVLFVKKSAREERIVLGMSGGRVLFLSPSLQVVAEGQVKGEVRDLAVADSSSPCAALVLSENGRSRQWLSCLSRHAEVAGDRKLDFDASQVALGSASDRAAVYGNGANGQVVAFYDLTGLDPRELWRKRDDRAADYSYDLSVSRDWMMFGLDDPKPLSRTSRLLALDSDGRLSWELPIDTSEGAYLYAHHFHTDSRILRVGTDDAMLSAYRLSAPPEMKRGRLPSGTSRAEK